MEHLIQKTLQEQIELALAATDVVVFDENATSTLENQNKVARTKLLPAEPIIASYGVPVTDHYGLFEVDLMFPLHEGADEINALASDLIETMKFKYFDVVDGATTHKLLIKKSYRLPAQTGESRFIVPVMIQYTLRSQ